MNSVIVLDSSDSEDEAPTKKIRALPVAVTKTHAKTKIPSGITVTRHSPALSGTKSMNTTIKKDAEKPAFSMLSSLITNNSPQNNKNNNQERQTTSSPSRSLLISPPESANAITPVSSNRKRKALSSTTSTASSACDDDGRENSSTPLPLITSGQSMTASSTPPLQLLATPPPQTSGISFSEHLMINSQLVNSHMPESTTITMHSPLGSLHGTSAAVQQTNNNNNTNKDNNANNINSNFKIMLPPKRQGTTATTISSPLASPVLRRTPSPALSTATTPVASTIRRIRPTTILRNSDEAWQRQRSAAAVSTIVSDDVLMSSSSANSPQSAAGSRPSSNPSSAHSSNCPSPITIMKRASPIIAAPSPPGQTPPPTVPAAKVILDLTDSPEKLSSDSSIPASTSLSKGDTLHHMNGQLDNSEASNSHPEQQIEDEQQMKPLPFEPEYEELINACRLADSSSDMEKLIEMKLKRYYYDVPSSFVSSRGFLKNVRIVTERITADPDLVYYNLKTIVDELKVRRKSKTVSIVDVDGAAVRTTDSPAGDVSEGTAIPATTTSTGNKRTDEQIKKLNRALYILQKRIEKLEQTDVDLDDDDSTYLQVERFKKRACQIYEKICDLTGESKSAHRMAKRPIQFSGTPIVKFNRTLQAYINRTREFPDYYDVMRMLEHCNRTYDLGLVHFEMTRIAQDAFLKVGKLLQTRRRNDLYETVTHFTANAKDPASSDAGLLAKLNENQKKRTKIIDILEKFARQQDMTLEEQRQARLTDDKNSPSEEQGNATSDEPLSSSSLANAVKSPTRAGGDYDDEDDDEDDDDEEEWNDMDADVDKLTNGATGSGIEIIDLSDTESYTENTTTSMSPQPNIVVKDEIEIDDGEGEIIVPTEKVVCSSREVKKPSTTETVSMDLTKCDNESRTMNNKNIMRAKTGEDERITTKVKHMANGKLRDTEERRPSSTPPNPSAKTTTKKTTTSIGMLKIASVTSLHQKEMSVNNKQLSNSTPNVDTTMKTTINSSPSPLSPAPALASSISTTTKKQHEHRTITEIVISDEES